MKKKLKLVVEQNISFINNVSVLIIGTLATQALLFFFTPFLSRIYKPEDFGYLGTFSTIGMVLSIIYTNKFEAAVIIPKTQEGAKKVVILGIIVSFLCFLFALITVSILFILNIGDFIFETLVVAHSFFIALFNIYMLLLHRELKYKQVSLFLVYQAVLQLITNCLLGYFKVKNGLIIGAIVGYLITSVSMHLYFLKTSYRFTKNDLLPLSKWVDEYKTYIDFPKYFMPNALLQVVNQQGIILVLYTLFGSMIVGFYSISNRILKLPFLVFVGSVGNIFKNNIKEAFDLGLPIAPIFKSNFKLLLSIGIVISLAAYFFIDYIFILFLGENWAGAIPFAKLLCISIITDLVETPLSFIYSLLNKQKIQFKIQLYGLLMTTLVLSIVSFFSKESIVFITTYIGCNVLISIVSLFFLHHYVAKPGKQ